MVLFQTVLKSLYLWDTHPSHHFFRILNVDVNVQKKKTKIKKIKTQFFQISLRRRKRKRFSKRQYFPTRHAAGSNWFTMANRSFMRNFWHAPPVKSKSCGVVINGGTVNAAQGYTLSTTWSHRWINTIRTKTLSQEKREFQRKLRPMCQKSITVTIMWFCRIWIKNKIQWKLNKKIFPFFFN